MTDRDRPATIIVRDDGTVVLAVEDPRSTSIVELPPLVEARP